MTEANDIKKLSPQKRRCIEALLTNGTIKSAATVAGVNRQTVYVWLKEEDFVLALREAEAAALEQLSRSLSALATGATSALHDALMPSQKITVRLRASETVLNALLRIREMATVEQRLRALEEKSWGN